MIHNHGPEKNDGLACNEIRLPDGSLMGTCQLTLYDIMLIAQYEANVKQAVNVYARCGINITEKDFIPNPEFIAALKRGNDG